jgi:predicted phosphodiesterase
LKSLVDIPDHVYQIYNANPGSSRRQLIELGLSEHEARIMAYVMKKGSVVNETQSIPNPEEGTVKTLIMADMHYPYHSAENVDIAINHGLKRGVTELVVAGDGCDMEAISYWFSKELRDVPFEDELELAKEELNKLASYFSLCRKIYIRGNHESRLLSYVCQNARKIKNIKIGGKALASVKDLLDLDTMGFEYVDNLELIQNGLKAFHIGKLYILHGDEPPKVTYSAINPAKLYYERLYTSAVVFHLHRSSEWIISKPLDGTFDGCWTGGCLCSMSPNYAVINRWHPGFMIVERDSEGYFEVNNHRIVNGRVV